jgi:anti-sigma factor RsiW
MAEYPAGWTCQLTTLRLDSYLLGALPLGESLAVAEHLEACPGCAQRLVLGRFEADGGPRG